MHRISAFMVLMILGAGCSAAEQPAVQDSRAAESAPSPVPRANDAAAPAAEDSRPIILAFGDSLTAGYRLPPGSGYPELLQAALDQRGYGYRVVNAGISGDTTSGGRGRLQSALQLKPEIVLLELGANDGLRGLPVEDMRANLDEIITAFKDAGTQVVLAGMTLPRNYGEDYVLAFEQVFRDLAEKHDVPLIPFLLEGVAARPELNLDDMIHPNEAGYRIVAQNVLEHIEPLLLKAE